MAIVMFCSGEKTLIGTVLSRGFFEVDQPECFEIDVPKFPHLRFIVPVTDCQPQ